MTRLPFNLSRIIFDKILRHVESQAIKLAAVFPYLIFNIIVDQRPSLVFASDGFSFIHSELLISNKQYQGTYHANIPPLFSVSDHHVFPSVALPIASSVPEFVLVSDPSSSSIDPPTL